MPEAGPDGWTPPLAKMGYLSRWFVERSSTENFLMRSPIRLSLLSGLFEFGRERL